jgi:hypothetical protein
LLLPIINKHYDPKVPTANKSTSENVLL